MVAIRLEIAKLIEASYPLGLNTTLTSFGHRLIDVGMIIFYALAADDGIEAAKIFTVVSFCTTMKKSFMVFLPLSMKLLSECRVTINRIEVSLIYGIVLAIFSSL